MNVMGGQPPDPTREEMRGYQNQGGGAPWGAHLPPPHGSASPPACLEGAPPPCPAGGTPHFGGVPSPGHAPPPPAPWGAPPRRGAPHGRQGACSDYLPPANYCSKCDSNDRDNPRPPVRRCLNSGPESSGRTASSGTTGGAGGVVR